MNSYDSFGRRSKCIKQFNCSPMWCTLYARNRAENGFMLCSEHGLPRSWRIPWYAQNTIAKSRRKLKLPYSFITHHQADGSDIVHHITKIERRFSYVYLSYQQYQCAGASQRSYSATSMSRRHIRYHLTSSFLRKMNHSTM